MSTLTSSQFYIHLSVQHHTFMYHFDARFAGTLKLHAVQASAGSAQAERAHGICRATGLCFGHRAARVGHLPLACSLSSIMQSIFKPETFFDK